MTKPKPLFSLLLFLCLVVAAPFIGGCFNPAGVSFLWICAFGALLLAPGAVGIGSKVRALCAAAFFILVIISAGVNRFPYFGLTSVLYAGSLLAAYVCAKKFFDEGKTLPVLRLLSLAAGVMCLWGIRDYAVMAGGGPEFWASVFSAGDKARMFGTFQNPNYLAGYLAVTLPAALALCVAEKNRIFSLLAKISLLAQTVALMFTGSRFGIAAFLLGLVVFALCAGKETFKKALPYGIVLLVTVFVFGSGVAARVGESTDSSSVQANSGLFRKYTWRATANMIKASPILGQGPGSYEITYPAFTIAAPTANAHQSYLQIAAESGVPASVLFLIFAGGVFLTGLKSLRNARSERRVFLAAAMAACLSCAARSLVDSDFYVMGIAVTAAVLMGLLTAGEDKSELPAWSAKTLCGIALLLGLQIFVSSAVVTRGAAKPYESYQTAAGICPWNPAYVRELAKQEYFTTGDGDAAAALIGKAIAMEPRNRANHEAKSLIALAMGDVKTAEESLEKALDLTPKSAFLIDSLAKLYDESGESEKADKLYKSLIDLETTPYETVKGAPEIVDSTYAYAHFRFGKKYLAEGKDKEARVEFAAAKDRLERRYAQTTMIEALKSVLLLTEEKEAEEKEMLADCERYIEEIDNK
ncbi:MAG: O-antigen ligase family protein [Abditibacteriota bacterium]|nr:O-antigen ligase family protein [Abditibacteriota bacterium]